MKAQRNKMMTCARDGFSVGMTKTPNGVVVNPIRWFSEQKKLRCWLNGQVFETLQEAKEALWVHGYVMSFFPRSSVPVPLFAKLAVHRQVCRFDVKYRLLRWRLKNDLPVEDLIKELVRLARKVTIFHPVANEWTSVLREGRSIGRLVRRQGL